jgi:5-methylcytosine-specific restriction endonuclease McrA
MATRKNGLKKKKYNLNAKIRSALRQVWRWSPERAEALRLARVQRGKYLCSCCNKLFGPREIQVDHIVSAGSLDDLNAYKQRLFCSVEGLNVQCKPCHALKTKLEQTKKKEESLT